MEYTIRVKILGAILVLTLGAAGGLIASTALIARAYRDRGQLADRSERTINVTGSARKRISSDLAVWRIRVVGEGKGLQEAFAALKAATDRVQEYLKAHDVPDAEVVLSAIQTETHYARDRDGQLTREVAGYSLERNFTITSLEINRVAGIAATVTELIEQGIQVVSDPPQYYYTQIAALKIDLIGAASKDARSRADRIAQNAGCRLGEVRSARMGVLQITRPNSTEVSSEGIYDTSTVDKDVTSVVALTLIVEPE